MHDPVDLESRIMLPPVLEIHMAWHPGDTEGAVIADALAEHFHGGAYASMLGGAVEVYARSVGWLAADDAPRPVAWPGGDAALLAGVAPAQCVAVVPVVGLRLMKALQDRASPWSAWFDAALQAAADDPEHVRVLPMRLLGVALQGRILKLLPPTQFIAEVDPHDASAEPVAQLRQRDLVQALAQWLSPQGFDLLKVFISHTKRLGSAGEPVAALVDAVREVLQRGRIGSFYDAHDLQPGADWDQALRAGAGTCAVLALRTDLYASRDWCQREVLEAKRHGMPVVMLEALTEGEQRGSFLLDHVARVPARREADGSWQTGSIRRAIQLLADAWLHRALWLRQEQLSRAVPPYDAFEWLSHAPEPCTLLQLLSRRIQAGGDTPGGLRLLHPDPPLAAVESQVLTQMAQAAGLTCVLEITTPRLLAGRGA
jgi:TIR domain